jgi:hypothetical protein
MARNMPEGNVGIYRTVVKTTFLEDSQEKTSEWNRDTGKYEAVSAHKAGEVVTEIFGPYVSKSQNQNYSQYVGYRKVQEEGKPWPDWIKVAEHEAHHQKLTPVLALQPSGALTLDLDWVDYR